MQTTGKTRKSAIKKTQDGKYRRSESTVLVFINQNRPPEENRSKTRKSRGRGTPVNNGTKSDFRRDVQTRCTKSIVKKNNTKSTSAPERKRKETDRLPKHVFPYRAGGGDR